jgi:hypothetical protein
MKVNVFDRYGETVGYKVELEDVMRTYHPTDEECLQDCLARDGNAILTSKDGQIYRIKNCEMEIAQ